MIIESTENQLINVAQQIGNIAETNCHYTNGLAKRIDATRKTLSELTIAELIKLDIEYKQYFNHRPISAIETSNNQTQKLSDLSKRLTLLDNALVDQAGASELLDIPASTLQKWRSTGEVELPFVKIGHSVKYNTADLRLWIENNTQHKPGVKA